MKHFKQWVDRRVIQLAANSLQTGKLDILKHNAARDLLADPLLLQLPESTPALMLEADHSFQYTSTIVTSASRNNLVHGRIFTTASNWKQKPFVILVHGWNAELHYFHILPRIARNLAMHGLNAALIELPYHLQRRPLRGENSIRDFISDDLPGMLLATRQSISDIHSLACWVRKQGCPQVAVWGFSLGAWLAGLYICQSELLSAAVLTTPVSNLQQAVQDLSFCHPIRASLDGHPLDLSPLNLARYRPRIPPDAIHITQGVYDLFVPEHSYRELSAAWSLPGWEEVPHSHITVLLSRKTMLGSIEWLAQQFREKPGSAYSFSS